MMVKERHIGTAFLSALTLNDITVQHITLGDFRSEPPVNTTPPDPRRRRPRQPTRWSTFPSALPERCCREI